MRVLGAELAASARSKLTQIDMLQMQALATLNSSGVHLSYFLTPEDISLKFKSFAHTELDKPEYTDIKIIKEHIRKNEDYYDLDRPIRPCECC